MRSRSAELHQWPSHDKYSACVETFGFSNYRCSKYLIGGETIAAERWSTLIFLHVEKDCRALTKFVSTTAYSKDESVRSLPAAQAAQNQRFSAQRLYKYE